MGTFTKKIGSGNVYDYWLYWNQNSQNVTNNTSNVTVKLYVKRNDGYANSAWRGYNDCTISLTVAGIRRYYTTTANIDTRNSKTVELASWTGDLSHNADGTFTMSMDGSFTFPGTTSLGGTWTISTSTALTTIPRATTPTLSASNVDMGNSVTINLPRASSSFTHKVWYRPSGGSWAIIADGATTSCVWTIPDLGGYIPNSTSLGIEISVETFNGSTKIGEKSVWMTATIPASFVPTISSVSISEATSGIAAKFGAFVQNKSTLAVAITASGVSGSTIARYETYIQAVAYREASFTSNLITTSGTIGVVTTVTDSRGRTAKVSNSVTILEYAPPKINSLSAWRIDTSGNTSDEGTRIAMAMNFAISSVGGKNDRTYNFKYRKSTDTDFTSFGSGTASTSYDDTQYFTTAPEISVDYAYIVRLEIADYFQTVAYDVQIPTAFTIMDFRSTGKGMAIGKVSEKDALEVAMNSEFTGQVKIFAPGSTVADSGFIRMYRADGTLCAFLATSDNGDGLNLHFYSGGAWTGVVKFTKDGTITAKNTSVDYIVEQGTSGIWVYRKWNSGFAECWGNEWIGTIPADSFSEWSVGSGTWAALASNGQAYPFTFTETPFVIREARNDGGSVWTDAYDGSTTNTGKTDVLRTSNWTVNNVRIQYYATGKWK